MAALTLTPVAAVAAGIGAAGGWPVVTVTAAAATALLAGAALTVATLRWRLNGSGDVSDQPGAPRAGRVAFRFIAVAAALYFGSLLAFAAPLSAHSADGRLWLAFALLVTFAVDTAAYATGRAIGRRRLAPSISPAKTWEGAAGGLLAGVAAGAVLAAILATLGEGFSLRPGTGAAVGVVLAVAAIAGDLAESWLKRRAGVKDAGGLIPGHGGSLDRLDSLAPNLAIVYYVQIWAGG
jgi:phosphatidate cytidylyltransferase